MGMRFGCRRSTPAACSGSVRRVVRRGWHEFVVSCPDVRTGPAKVRCWSTRASSFWGLGTLRRYVVRSWGLLGLWRSGWIQLLSRSSGTRRLDRAPKGEGVVADRCDLVEVQSGEELGDQGGERRQGASEGAAAPMCALMRTAARCPRTRGSAWRRAVGWPPGGLRALPRPPGSATCGSAHSGSPDHGGVSSAP